jgi:hypothetical protein
MQWVDSRAHLDILAGPLAKELDLGQHHSLTGRLFLRLSQDKKTVLRIRIHPYVFEPPGSASGSISQRYGSGSFYHQAKIVRKTFIPTVLWFFFMTFYLWKMM